MLAQVTRDEAYLQSSDRGRARYGASGQLDRSGASNCSPKRQCSAYSASEVSRLIVAETEKQTDVCLRTNGLNFQRLPITRRRVVELSKVLQYNAKVAERLGIVTD